MAPLFSFIEGIFSPSHMVILLIIGFLIFGKRLPELGRSLGSSLKEFKKGMQGLEDEVPMGPAIHTPQLTGQPLRPPQRIVPATPTAPKFEENAAPATTPPTA
jgi:sec-independent protein translocase protein TatA